jgi:hypothetical protein
MRAEEYPRIDPDDRQAINNETQGDKKCKQWLIFMNVGEDQVFANKSRCYWKSRHRQTGQQETKASRGFQGLPAVFLFKPFILSAYVLITALVVESLS